MPSFNMNKDIDVLGISQVCSSSVLKRISEISDVKNAYIEERDTRKGPVLD